MENNNNITFSNCPNIMQTYNIMNQAAFAWHTMTGIRLKVAIKNHKVIVTKV